VRSIVDEMPQLDIPCARPGVGSFTSILNTKTSAVRAMLDVHILGFAHIARPGCGTCRRRRVGTSS